MREHVAEVIPSRVLHAADYRKESLVLPKVGLNSLSDGISKYKKTE